MFVILTERGMKIERKEAHHVCHKVGMIYKPRPCSGPGRQSWTRACVVGGGPDSDKRKKKEKEKKNRVDRGVFTDDKGCEKGREPKG
jgi:hypothetical protein